MFQHLLLLPTTDQVAIYTRNNCYILHHGRVRGGILPNSVQYDKVEQFELDQPLVLTYRGSRVLRTSPVVHASELVRIGR